jgi:CRISPR-associated endonuclease Csn1
LKEEFGLNYISRNDIIKYKLYLELADNGFKTLYSNTYIQPEKLFSKEFDTEHIIPQSRLFDDSFSNKTLETRSINIDKGNETAYDYISHKYGQEGLENYIKIIEDLLKKGKISKGKYLKLRMKGENIPDDFIERDIRDTQYIAKKAKSMLEEIAKYVVSTSGSITDKLREDWQLIDVMQELNWEKYEKLGMTEIIENGDGQRIRKIIDWTKRNDHRHHAMDALTVAFTKRSHIQYLNNLNARSDKSGSIYGIEAKETYRDERGKIKFKPPIPLNKFRAEAKKQLESILISIKAKNKVVTKNINSTIKAKGLNKKIQLTPHGQLHLETIYGSNKQYTTKIEKIGAAFDEEKIMKVAKKKYREALIKRLQEYENDPKKAFTGKNSLEKNPIWIDRLLDLKMPEKVKIVDLETLYTIRKEITPDLKIDKVVDSKIRRILEARLDEYEGNNKKAFSNLEENPIWLNQEKGIRIKRVKITGISNAVPLHEKKDKNGKLITNEEGKNMPTDFVNTGNNHHVAIYRDDKGNLQDNVVSFFEVVERVNQNQPIIDKEFKKDEGWEFLFSMKQNEYFVFPNEKTGFNPAEVDLLNPDNYHFISPNLFRVQKLSKIIYGISPIRDYVFRHHLEAKINDNKELKDVGFKSIKSLPYLEKILKVKINHIGQITSIGEY